MKFLSFEHLGIIVAVAGVMFLQRDVRLIDALILYGVLLANVRILKLKS
jgi:hypothetical protein